MSQARFQSLARFLRARFSSEGHLGLHLTVGLLIVIAAAWVFADIAEDVFSSDPITILDVQIAQWFHVHATPPVTQFMLVVTNIHATAGILVMSVLLGSFFFWKKAWYWLLALAIAVPGGMLFNVLLKHLFQRPRPAFDNPLLTLTTFSFPSGHTAGATLFYGVLAAYLLCNMTSTSRKILVVLIAILLVLAVGLSRIYLGVHYFSDVLAAIAASGAWLTFSITTVSTMRRHAAMRRTANY
jgi:membrane-associated phospholipid phosphatase